MATGIEITGLVLAAFPLLISGLEHYAGGVETIKRWWRYERELASLRRLLIAEMVVFQGTCEQLLNGLVTTSKLDDLISNSLDSEWKDVELDKKLQQRLGRSYVPYFECVREMVAIATQLQDMLELDSSQKVSNVLRTTQSDIPN